MSPKAIARAARLAGIGLAALSDHNSALNCPAFIEACAEEGIMGLAAMEAESAEEVHCLLVFPSPEAALDMGELAYRLLPDIRNDPARHGDQVAVDRTEAIIAMPEKRLANALPLGLDALRAEARARGALFIPAHVDRPSFSLTSQLGFIPMGDYDAIELSRFHPGGRLGPWAHIRGSDAHSLEAVGSSATAMLLDDALLAAHGPFAALKAALGALAASGAPA
jgi:hypothetical protein